MLYFLNTSLTVILALFFLLVGIFSFLLAWSPEVQVGFIDLVQNNFWFWIIFSLGFFLISASLSAYTYMTYRKFPLITRSGPNITTINDAVIHTYLQSYFQKLFPKQQIPYRFLLKKQKMQIKADLPYIPFDDQKNLLNTMQGDLSEILDSALGYHQTVELSLSFDRNRGS